MTGILEGRSALVTGAAMGIGRACALALAREGARVALADLNEAACKETAEEVRNAGAESLALRADVTREEDVEAMVAAAVERFGGLDCAVNNAGITGGMGAIQDLSFEAFNQTLALNLGGVFLSMKHELRAMIPRGAGSIVNLASGAGLVATPGLAAYCASKHGVLGLTKTAAHENARTGVRVNAVCPGATDTPMLEGAMAGSDAVRKLILSSSPTGRLGRAEEIAEAVVWLCSDRASFVSGESMLVDGGAVAR